MTFIPVRDGDENCALGGQREAAGILGFRVGGAEADVQPHHLTR